MNRFLTLCLFALILISSCTKNKIQPPDPPVVDTTIVDTTIIDSTVIDTTKPPIVPKDRFVTRAISSELRYFYVDADVNTDLFLGSLWDLKDTSGGLEIETMKTISKPFSMDIYFQDLLVEPEMNIVPTYDLVKAYISKSLTNRNTRGSGHFNSTGFSDYHAIKLFLGNNKDVAKITDLIIHDDSTTIRKANGQLLDAQLAEYTVSSFSEESRNQFAKENLPKWKSQGLDPYYVSIAVYGRQVFFMGESDSTGNDLQAALRKLLAEDVLSEQNKAVLAAGSLLVYYRTDVKDPFIKYAEGLAGIEQLAAEFQQAFKNYKPTYNYPLYYYLSSVEEDRYLRYTFNFNLWVEQQ